jgi:hypothetical protein
MDQYMQHHAAIDSLPEMQDISNHAIDHISDVTQAVNDGKMTAKEAQSAYDALQTKYEQQLKDAGADAKTAKTAAAKALKDAQTMFSKETLSTAINAGDKAANSVSRLRRKVVAASQKAMEGLKTDEGVIPLKPLANHAAEIAHDLRELNGEYSDAQADRIEQYVQDLIAKHGDSMGLAEAKRTIQGLDRETAWVPGATNFDSGLNSAKKQLRGHLDDMLKTASPEYAADMKPVAEDMELLKKLKRYDTAEKASTRIKSLNRPDVYKNEMPLLRQLEERTGAQFTHEIEPYANEELSAARLKALPEQAEADKTAADLENILSRETSRKMEATLNASPEAKALREAQAALEAAQAEKAKFPKVTPQNVQSKLQRIATPGKDVAMEAILSQIPGMEGKSLPEMMQLMRLAQAFEKQSAKKSSKMVNQGAMMLGYLGNLTGHGLLGMAAGALLGAFTDTDGPVMTKHLLDLYIKRYGDIPSMAKTANPGAARMMLNKVLGSEMPPSGDAFKAGVDYFSSVHNADKSMTRAASNILKPGHQPLMPTQYPKVADRDKLDKTIQKYEQNPNMLLAQAQSPLGHYLPEQNAAVSKALASQLNYLQSLKPAEAQGGLLDKKLPPSPAQEARYNRAKDIQIQPNIVLQHVKDGTIQVTDVADLQALYPSMYGRMKQQLMEEIANRHYEEGQIPYHTRVGMSIFLGQPLDSSMNPMNIQAAQPQQPQMPPQQGQPKPKPAKVNEKNANMYQTSGQEAERDRSSRK